MSEPTLRRFNLGILLLGALTAGGCAQIQAPLGDLFQSPSSDLVVQEQQAEQTAAASRPTATYLVEIHPAKKSPQKFELPLTEEPVYMQEVLTKSQALERFGRVKIELWRHQPDGLGYHKLKIPFDRKTQSVPASYDYAIHPRDRLVFTEDTSTVLDDMLLTLSGTATRFTQ